MRVQQKAITEFFHHVADLSPDDGNHDGIYRHRGKIKGYKQTSKKLVFLFGVAHLILDFWTRKSVLKEITKKFIWHDYKWLWAWIKFFDWYELHRPKRDSHWSKPKKDTGPAFSYGVETIMCCAQAKKQRDGKQKDVSLFD